MRDYSFLEMVIVVLLGLAWFDPATVGATVGQLVNAYNIERMK